MLRQDEMERGKEVFHINKEKIASFWIEDGQLVTTQPRLDDSDDEVTPCGVFTKSQNHKDMQLLCRLPSKTKIVPILSVRAIECQSMYDLEILITSPGNSKLALWIAACLGNQLFCRRKKVSTVC